MATVKDTAIEWLYQAQRSAILVHGPRFDLVRGATVFVRAPARLVKTYTVGAITFKPRKEWEVPAAEFWPNGKIPAEFKLIETSAPAQPRPDFAAFWVWFGDEQGRVHRSMSDEQRREMLLETVAFHAENDENRRKVAREKRAASRQAKEVAI
jgi:hypothetical protein